MTPPDRDEHGRSDCAHERYKMVAHADSCHWYSWTYRCVDCSETFVRTYTRALDDYFGMWAQDDCEGCRAVEQGREPDDEAERQETLTALEGIKAAAIKRMDSEATK